MTSDVEVKASIRPDPGTTGAITITIFGQLRISHDGHELAPGPLRHRIVLAQLICAAGRVISIDSLIDALWENEEPPSAVNQVHRIVGKLRRALEPGLPPHAAGRIIQAAGAGYRLAPDAVRCDLYELRTLVSQAETAVAADDLAAGTDCYARAVKLARGMLFGGLSPGMAHRPEFEAIEQERVATAIAAADLAITASCSAQTLATLVAVAASARLNEPLHARLISLLGVSGRRAEGLSMFDTMRRRLAEELGVDPGAELVRAHHELLASDFSPSGRSGNSTPRSRPAQLPRPLPGFAQRSDAAIVLAEGGSDRGGTVVIAIGGMGGIGKTALAVHWAHQVIDDYPDGQLYVNLRGFDPTNQPVEPGDALNTLLHSLGQSPAEMAELTIDAQAARYRSAIAGRRMILILDNARDSDQVRPLLPGSPQCLVLVTSRNRLAGLVAREGARFVPLGRLTPPEARTLLAHRLSASRIAAEPQAVSAIIDGCAGLPLALSIVASRIATNPEVPIKEQVSRLFGPTSGLDLLSLGEGRDDVRSVFSWSYAALPADGARLFRLLGAHPGPDFSLTSVANLLGVPAATAQRIAGGLVNAHMLTSTAADRYVMHDLLRRYAGELLDAAGDRSAAGTRMVEEYLIGT